jgi:hypothetical protein
MHLDIMGVVIAIPRIAPSRIVVRHRRLLPASGPAGLDTNKGTVGVIALADIRERLMPRRNAGISGRGVRAWPIGERSFAACLKLRTTHLLQRQNDAEKQPTIASCSETI